MTVLVSSGEGNGGGGRRERGGGGGGGGGGGEERKRGWVRDVRYLYLVRARSTCLSPSQPP